MNSQYGGWGLNTEKKGKLFIEPVEKETYIKALVDETLADVSIIG